MKKRRTICIGDVHGCLDELKELLQKTEWTPDDRVVLVGDLVDRGPDPAGCVRFVRQSGFECVAGNHDNKLARYYTHELTRGEKKNPMRLKATAQVSYDALEEEDLQWLCTLPDILFLEEYNTLIVHAGVRPGQDPFDQPGNVYRHCRYVYPAKNFKLATLDTKTFMRPEGSVFWSEAYDGVVNIVHGHHVESVEQPISRINAHGSEVVGIDTGCCFGGRLSALILEEGKINKIIQVDAKKEYYGKRNPVG